MRQMSLSSLLAHLAVLEPSMEQASKAAQVGRDRSRPQSTQEAGGEVRMENVGLPSDEITLQILLLWTVFCICFSDLHMP